MDRIRAFLRRVFFCELQPARTSKRSRNLAIALAVLLSVEVGQAINVQALTATEFMNAHFSRENKDSELHRTTLTALRGSILDRNGEVLAYDEETFTIVADPAMIRTNGAEDDNHQPDESAMDNNDRLAASTLPARLAQLLAKHIGGTEEEYFNAITDPAQRNSRYLILAKNVSKYRYRLFLDEYTAINAALAAATDTKRTDNQDVNPKEKLLGINVEKSTVRKYPGGTLAANVIGYVQYDAQAKEYRGAGLEYEMRDTLAGTDGYEEYEGWDSRRIPLGESKRVEPVNGPDLTLTIDAGLQSSVDQILADRVTEMRADFGTAVVMDVNTGEVLAMSNYPTFDPNAWTNATAENAAARENVSADDLNNRAVSYSYTPGSVQKTLTFAALLDSGLVEPDEIIQVPGTVKSGNNVISDSWGHGDIDLYARGILAKSSNVGTVLLSRRMDKNKLLEYYQSFGLGSATGVGLPGEADGILPEKDMPDYSRDGMAFGGSALIVTTLQEAAAVAAVTNGGIYNQPTILKSTTKADGTVQGFDTKESKRVISEKASKQVVSMMETMAQNNGAHTFDVDGYRVGAKTGTSKRLNLTTGKYEGYVTSTISVAPVEDPQYLVYVVVDNPREAEYGATVAGPAEQDIMSIVLPRYGVAPSTEKAPKLPVAP
ncbi:MAG: penicillin-binding protein 2 [Propionibacteriaceae bacterium]|jgi:cell division protein FtsI (penicillin-binding protein 3)|nr:penicillin-binding protein 2 [Propionibacteriaceae bacterium]